MRKMTLALACASILGTSHAQAMGLGELIVRSHLNQPLRAEIPVLDVAGISPDVLRARLADAQAFERQGYAYRGVAGRLQVQLEGGKSPRIVLTSKSPIHEPVLGVVIELAGPGGVIQRAYDILLDPVSYRTPSLAITPPTSSNSPAHSGLALQGQVEQGYYRVHEGETLWRVAYNLRPPGVSVEQMMAALREANPRAFAGAGKNGALLTGSLLRIPSLEEIQRIQEHRKETPASKKPPAASDKASRERPAEPKLTIVAPVQSTPAVAAAPVAGEAVNPAAPAVSVSEAEVIQLREQLEAVKAEKEMLLQRLGGAEAQMAKMEELLRLKDEQIRQLEQLLQQAQEAAASNVSSSGVAAQEGRESDGASSKLAEPQPSHTATPLAETKPPAPSAETKPPAPSAETKPPAPSAETKPPAPVVAKVPEPVTETEEGLMSLLTQPMVLGGAGALALLVALLLGHMRRRRESTSTIAEPLNPPATPADVRSATPLAGKSAPAEEAAMPLAAAATLASASTAAELASEALHTPPVDPVQAVLEEVDVLLAYGLHDRALGVLEEALARQPEAAQLEARRVRLFHEMGAREAFLKAAQDYRQAHPAQDDPYWPEIESLGKASYADAPLFAASSAPAVTLEPHSTSLGGSAKEASPLDVSGFGAEELAHEAPPSKAEPAEELKPLDLQDFSWTSTTTQPKAEGTALREPSSTPELEPLTLDWSTAPQPLAGSETAHDHESKVQPELSLDALSLEPLSLDLPSDDATPPQASASAEAPSAPDLAFKLEGLTLPELEPKTSLSLDDLVSKPAEESESLQLSATEKASALAAVEAGISEDDLLLLGLDTDATNLDRLDLELPELDLETKLTPLPEPSVPQVGISVPAPEGSSAPVQAFAPSAASFVLEPEIQPAKPIETVKSTPSARVDEYALKLDMAEALLELGDRAGARELLDEVLASGNEAHIQRARALLAG